MSELSDELIRRCKEVKLLLLDCDGVLTDGRLYYGADGEALKVFDVHDGQGIVDWIRAGNHAAIISGRNSPIVAKRAADLGIAMVRQGIKDKVAAADEIVNELGVPYEHTAFIGDDIVDLKIMAKVGFAVAVANALDEVKQTAHHVTQRRGGRGAVREVIDLMLSHRQC